MKRQMSLSGSIILTMVAITCTMGAVISGFSFYVDTMPLALTWLASAVASSVAVYFWNKKGILALALPVLAFIAWKLPEIAEGGKYVVCYISTEYNKWLFIPVLFPGAKAARSYELTLFFAAAGIVQAFILAPVICMRRSTLLTVLFSAPFVFLTFVLVSNRPDTWFLIGLLAVYLMLLANKALYPDGSGKRGNGKGIFPALICTTALLATAYLAAPAEFQARGEYIDSLDQIIRSFAERSGFGRIKNGVGWPPGSADGIWRFNTGYIGVADAGIREIRDIDLLEIEVDEPGTYYLRGYSMQQFDGRAWNVNSESLKLWQEPVAMAKPAYILQDYCLSFPDDASNQVKLVTMKITETGSSSAEVDYVPYYGMPGSGGGDSYERVFAYTEGSVPAFAGAVYSAPPLVPDGITLREELGSGTTGSFSEPGDSNSRVSLTVTGGVIPVTPRSSTLDLTEYNRLVCSSETYTQIDGFTARGLRRIAQEAGVDINADRATIADMVAGYISSVGQYTLSPYMIPEGEDFALYFLESSKQGYCIHYATAATLMLRALDIPARFTSGFVVTAAPGSIGQTLVVTDRLAHTWVEVYYDDIGWIPLEVTPPAAGSGIPGGRPHSAPIERAPSSEGGDGYPDDMPPDWLQDQIESGRQNQAGQGTGAAPGADAQDTHGFGWIKTGILAAICIAAVVTLFFLRRTITQNYWKKRFSQADTNAAVISAWLYASRLNRKAGLPDEIESLALKARFSLHLISEDERSGMIDYTRKRFNEVYKYKSRFGQLWIKYGLGL